MPKKRQVPFLHDRQLADGTRAYDWVPSPKLRKLGHVRIPLGFDYAEAIRKCLQINAELAGSCTKPGAATAPRVLRFEELVSRYLDSTDYARLKPASKREYRSRLNWLKRWTTAPDGQSIDVRRIDRDMIEDLRELLGRGSDFQAAAIMRVLRMLLVWAKRKGLIRVNPAEDIRMRLPPPRRVQMLDRARAALLAEADAALSLYIELGFWTLQREADILAFNRFSWRALPNILTADTATLGDALGRVWGFELHQQKTDAGVVVPVVPHLLPTIEARFAVSQWLFPHPEDANKPMPNWMMQRGFGKARERAAAKARKGGDEAMAVEIERCQLRDLRRTGMTWLRQSGATDIQITAVSGHAAIGRKSVLDVYLVRDPKTAASAVALGYRRWQAEQEAQETV